MIEEILNFISQLTPFWLYVFLFIFAYIENIFPPSPSDLVVVIGGSLIAHGEISFFPTFVLTTIGSIAGFMTLYFIGKQVDMKVVHSGKYKHIPIETLDKAEKWFNKYGYGIILANRFMPGTRSVISFFAGMSQLSTTKTFIYGLISASIWNIIIIYLGIVFGNNIPLVDKWLNTYSNFVIILTVAVALLFIIRYYIKKKK